MKLKYPLHFKIAETIQEKDLAKKLIYDTFTNRLGFTDVKEDPFDHSGLFLIATNNSKIIATVRFIKDSKKGLPLDAYYDLTGLRTKAKSLAEVSRLAVLDDCDGLYLLSKSVKFLHSVAYHHNVTDIVIDSLIELENLYKRIGFRRYGKPFFDPTICISKESYNIANSIVMHTKTHVEKN